MNIIALIVRTLLRLFFRAELRGKLEYKGKLLLIANHQSFLDGIALGAFLPVKPTWLVHSQVASQWHFALGLRFLPHYVIDTASPMAIKAMVNLVDQGKPVLIFPEGRITNTGGLMKIYDGPAFVAARTGADVVVAHVEGFLHTKFGRMSGDVPRQWFPRIGITLCPAQKILMPQGKTAKIRRRRAADAMRRIMMSAEVYARKDTTIHESFFDAIDLHGRGRLAVEDIQGALTYGQLLKASLALGRIVSKFTNKDEHVAVLMPNANAHLALLIGMFTFKRVPAILNFTSGSDGVMNACNITRARTIITSRAFVEKAKLGPMLEKVQGVEIRYLEDLRATLTAGDKLWLVLRALPNPRAIMEKVDPGSPAVVLFTSGSEAKPKGVVLSHRNIMSNIVQSKALFDCTSKDRFFTAMPMFHSFGLCTMTFLPITTGCRVFLYPSPLHYRVIPELIYDRDCTFFAATPTFLANYTKVGHPYDMHTLRVMVVGAEKLPDDVRRNFMDKFGVRAVEGYGVTECSPIVAANSLISYRGGTVGQILPDLEYRLEPLPGISEGGILHVRGPNVMLGYLKSDNPGVLQPPSSIYGPGWYSTGDLVTIDEDGFLTIQGRVKRFAKVAGEMISLEVVEQIARAASPRHEHASATATVSGRGEVVYIYTEDPELKREQIQQAARAAGAPDLAIPRKIVFMRKLPVLGGGKRDYVTLNKMAQEESGH